MKTTAFSFANIQDNQAIYGRLRWRKVQQLAEEFWDSWRNQYLSNITKRHRWETKRLNIKVGDFVAIVDEHVIWTEWKIGVIEQVKVGEDGLVRSGTVRLANALVDKQGVPIEPAKVLDRPIQKLVVLQPDELQE